MDHETDVEHLFSWLQTPELRFREFASAREITDTIRPVAGRPNAVVAQVPPSESPPQPVAEVHPGEPFAASEPSSHAPATIAPTSSAEEEFVAPARAAEPVASPRADDTFALGPGEDNAPHRPEFAELVAPPPIAHAAPSAVESDPAPMPAPVPHAVPPAATGGALLGGAYREEGPARHDTQGPQSAPPPSAPPPSDTQPGGTHSLDAVFGRLGGGDDRLPNPRERMKHIPGLTPPRGRPR
jgi:hypothetical protein